METRDIVTIALAVIALLGGAFGAKLLDRWFDRDKQRTTNQDTNQQREFADNEQARKWLQEQLRDRDSELDQLRTSEITLLQKVALLAEQVGRLEERSAAQANQIVALQDSVNKWGNDYAEMKSERDMYRSEKHDLSQEATADKLRAQLAQRDLTAANTEIARLRGQLSAVTGSREPLEPQP